MISMLHSKTNLSFTRLRPRLRRLLPHQVFSPPPSSDWGRQIDEGRGAPLVLGSGASVRHTEASSGVTCGRRPLGRPSCHRSVFAPERPSPSARERVPLDKRGGAGPADPPAHGSVGPTGD